MARLGQVSADTTPISGPRGGAHAMPCSGPQGGVPEPRLVFQTIVPVRSRDVASTRPPALGCCHPSHRTAAVQRHRIRDSMVRIVVQRHCRQGIMCRMKLRAKTKGRRHRDLSKHSTPSPPPPLKHHKKGETIPFTPDQQTPIQRHPCTTPLHNRRRTTSIPPLATPRRNIVHPSTRPRSISPPRHPPCPSLVPPAPCDGKSPAIYLPLPIFSFHESSLPGPDGSCTRGGVCVCVCAAALVLCNHTIETTKARRASSQCQHGSETVSHTHTQTHGQI